MSIRKMISWTAVILMMVLLFSLSNQPSIKSNVLSEGITDNIVLTIETIMPNFNIDRYSFNIMLRKSAHFFAYLILGIIVIYALRRSGVRGYRSIVLALGICVLFAIVDEVHQLFVPGRSGQVRDVVIDGAGAIVGVGLYLIVGSVVKHIN
ncbi:VanZ family protein [Virgibacillus sp. NKC19-16]|uniref:VanZ family protein n=1 Tax=Virgibacillus salidurans TaxID=2831673 RepID=UPI001F2938EA|nr:VanZ family protein [Virgibacillus sp. NKC19-16]UJL45806.1 VanZ family protein [Virgibacillus sp. NKC19-16]